jgi:TctA family transporter
LTNTSNSKPVFFSLNYLFVFQGEAFVTSVQQANVEIGVFPINKILKMASSKKKQDEENLKILREMVALTHNKHCFDCNQRGPTYINMTIGSFICTSCSGLL